MPLLFFGTPTPTSRAGMTSLLEELRGMTEAGTADYTVGTTLYWSDNSLQDILDIHRQDYVHYPLTQNPIVASGGTVQYFDHLLPAGFFEQTTGGSAIFYIQDSTGATMAASLWSADYRRGWVTFTSDTQGTAFYVTGRAYDLNASAADVWRKKAAHYAPTSFDFSTDNHSIKREQVYTHCQEMADFFGGMSEDAFQMTERFRSDM